jgi:hypothetical protein
MCATYNFPAAEQNLIVEIACFVADTQGRTRREDLFRYYTSVLARAFKWGAMPRLGTKGVGRPRHARLGLKKAPLSAELVKWF